MSIEVFRTSIFEPPVAEWLVNPVNCVGVCGRGLALEFARRFPLSNERYLRACVTGKTQPGWVQLVESPATVVRSTGVRAVVYFPTKKHWRDAADISYIESGMAHLASLIELRRPASVAIPALGCGLGGLNWAAVESVIRRQLNGVHKKFAGEETLVFLYSPKEKTLS